MKVKRYAWGEGLLYREPEIAYTAGDKSNWAANRVERMMIRNGLANRYYSQHISKLLTRILTVISSFHVFEVFMVPRWHAKQLCK
jgi:hypothetical protein